MEGTERTWSNVGLWMALAVCMGLSYALTFWLAPESWSLVKTLLAGAFGGVGSFFCLFANHVLMSD